MGYPKETCGYYYYHLEDQKVFIAKRSMFLKKEHILGGNNKGMIELSEVGESNSDTILEVSSVQEQCTQEFIPKGLVKFLFPQRDMWDIYRNRNQRMRILRPI